jgi:hypothetical protein
MRQDPIVRETRVARAKLFAECEDDLDMLMNRLKASEEQDKDRVVTIEIIRKKRQTKDPSRRSKR